MKHNNLITVVADNRLMADTIAKAIGANTSLDGYYHGNGYAVTWTNGTVIEATFKPDNSFVMSTDMDARLVYAHNFDFSMRDYDRLLGYRKSEQDIRQLETIKNLWKKSDKVVNAMYPSFEGECGFLNLYFFMSMPVKVHRAWLPVLTKQAVINAITRERSDIEAYEEWLEECVLDHINRCSDETEDVQIDEQSPLYDEDRKVTAGDEFEEDGLLISIVKDTPLYNTCSMFIAAEMEYGFSLYKTQQIALSLYAKKLISFPLVIQNGVPASVWRYMKHNIRTLALNPKWGHLVDSSYKPSRRNNYSSGELIFDGYGIVTTGLHPTDLNRDEEKLYNLIVKRVIDAFRPDAESPKNISGKSSKSNKTKAKTA